ncbi:hypothetical protein LZ32DRAFT_676189 [Colletotrichum eremochloae]|nr:hypothetical protein LZ32DRAFT_676189 [Colletotrichum eremochloae]
MCLLFDESGLLAKLKRALKENDTGDPDNKTTLTYQWRPALKDLLPSDKLFPCNCVGFLVKLILVIDVLKKALGHLASAFRCSITTQGTREQVKAYDSLIRKDPRAKVPPFFACSLMQLLMTLNCRKAKIYCFNLSHATIQPQKTLLFSWYVQIIRGPYNFTDEIIAVGKGE